MTRSLERMTKRKFLSRHGIVRNAIREDVIFFAFPALLIFFAGLIVSARDGYDGLLSTIWDLVRQPENLRLLSIHNTVGLALTVIGFTILLVAMGTLWWSHSPTLVIREGHQLITHGIYRFIRHPMYLGVIVFFIGFPVFAASLYGFFTSLVMIPIFLYRIRLEEGLLAEHFQDAFQKYKKTTRRLIPFIY